MRISMMLLTVLLVCGLAVHPATAADQPGKAAADRARAAAVKSYSIRPEHLKMHDAAMAACTLRNREICGWWSAGNYAPLFVDGTNLVQGDSSSVCEVMLEERATRRVYSAFRCTTADSPYTIAQFLSVEFVADKYSGDLYDHMLIFVIYLKKKSWEEALDIFLNQKDRGRPGGTLKGGVDLIVPYSRPPHMWVDNQ